MPDFHSSQKLTEHTCVYSHARRQVWSLIPETAKVAIKGHISVLRDRDLSPFLCSVNFLQRIAVPKSPGRGPRTRIRLQLLQPIDNECERNYYGHKRKVSVHKNYHNKIFY